MDENSVNSICWSCLKLLNQSDKWKQINDDYANENEIQQEGDEDDKEMFEQEQKNEDELQTSIEGIFGALFKSHSSLCGKLLETLFSDFIPVYLDKEAPFIK